MSRKRHQWRKGATSKGWGEGEGGTNGNTRWSNWTILLNHTTQLHHPESPLDHVTAEMLDSAARMHVDGNNHGPRDDLGMCDEDIGNASLSSPLGRRRRAAPHKGGRKASPPDADSTTHKEEEAEGKEAPP